MSPDTPLSPRPSAKADPSALRPRVVANGSASGGPASPPGVEDTPIESPDEIQRWTARRRTAVVLSVLKGEMTLEEVARRHGLVASEVEDWKQRFLAAAHNALRSRPRDEEALRDDQIRRLKQKVGELVLEVDMLRDATRSARAGGLDEADE